MSDAPLAELLDCCMRAVHEGLGDQNVRVYAEACMAVPATCPIMERKLKDLLFFHVLSNARVFKMKQPTMFKLFTVETAKKKTRLVRFFWSLNFTSMPSQLMAGHRSFLLWNRGWSTAGGPFGPPATSALRSHGRFQRGGTDTDHTGHVSVAEPTHRPLGRCAQGGFGSFLLGSFGRMKANSRHHVDLVGSSWGFIQE